MKNEQSNSMTDIILPVYNALEELKNCIASIKENTAKGTYRLIIIDDYSSDKNVEPYINSLESEDIIAIYNKENLGYTHNINHAISMSGNDFVTLNSDTIVTPGWLEKIKRGAYSDDAIGTVTPLTNNGSVCSVPYFSGNNVLPEGLSINQYSAMVERYSFKEYPTIPVGVGFCMYIKRKVIEDIGLFDEITFRNGYGEELDFCIRASLYGYLHVLCDDTFIWHKGTSSFNQAKKEELQKRSEKILFDKYPRQINLASEFIKSNPLIDIQNNVLLHQNMLNGKKNILYILHADFEEDSDCFIGGTQLHVQDLIKNIHSYNFFVLVHERDMLKLTAYIDGNKYKFIYIWDETIIGVGFTNRKYIKIIENILTGFNIDLVHVQHLKDHTFDVFYAAKKLGIPLYLTLHDLYMICPTINLINDKNEFCGGRQEQDICRRCLNNKLGINMDITQKWRSEVSNVFNMVEKIFVPTESLKNTYISFYPEIISKVFIFEHGVEEKSIMPIPKTGSKFRVAFVGGLSQIKGSTLAGNVIRSYKSNDIEWHFFGISGDDVLTGITQQNFYKHGMYRRDEIIKLLHKEKINLVCILSICPESYCYTLTESLLAGIPVLTTNIGAQGQRIEANKAGWLVDYQSGAPEVLQKILQIKNDTDEYLSKCSIVQSLKFHSVKDMCGAYVAEYDKINKSADFNYPVDSWSVFSANQNSNHLPYVEWRIREIENSYTWKIVNRIRKIKFPFKQSLIRLIIKIIRR